MAYLGLQQDPQGYVYSLAPVVIYHVNHWVDEARKEGFSDVIQPRIKLESTSLRKEVKKLPTLIFQCLQRFLKQPRKVNNHF